MLGRKTPSFGGDWEDERVGGRCSETALSLAFSLFSLLHLLILAADITKLLPESLSLIALVWFGCLDYS